MLLSTVPLFPLPNVVLFPGVFLPLHVFEPRYRAMTADALSGDRVLGMVLLRPGWEADYDGRPAVFEVGCAGVITHAERLADGRYNMVIKGVSRFRILAEDHTRPYRIARVDPVPDPLGPDDRAALRDGRQQLEALLAPLLEGGERRLPSTLADDEVVNALAQYVALDPMERQALLECTGPVARCRLLLELLHMKAMGTRGQAGPAMRH
jgi:Lon protease-like protein